MTASFFYLYIDTYELKGCLLIVKVIKILSGIVEKHQLLLTEIIEKVFFIAFTYGQVFTVDEKLVLANDINLVNGYNK